MLVRLQGCLNMFVKNTHHVGVSWYQHVHEDARAKLRAQKFSANQPFTKWCLHECTVSLSGVVAVGELGHQPMEHGNDLFSRLCTLASFNAISTRLVFYYRIWDIRKHSGIACTIPSLMNLSVYEVCRSTGDSGGTELRPSKQVCTQSQVIDREESPMYLQLRQFVRVRRLCIRCDRDSTNSTATELKTLHCLHCTSWV